MSDTKSVSQASIDEQRAQCKADPKGLAEVHSKMRNGLGDAMQEMFDLTPGEVKMMNGMHPDTVDNLIDSLQRTNADPDGKISYTRGQSDSGPSFEFSHHVVATPDPAGTHHKTRNETRVRCMK